MAQIKVLFLCIGNSCRSPMAEAFARAYGSDVLEAQSAGLAPAISIAPLTYKVMRERNLGMEDLYPKDLDEAGGGVQLIINMSGHKLPRESNVQVEDWEVRDPIGESEEVFRQVRDVIERRVLELIDALRSGRLPVPEDHNGSPVDTHRRPTRQ